MFFVRSEYKYILVESINYCVENKGLVVYGWVIMTSHVHLIIGTKQEPMQNIVRDLKKLHQKQLYKQFVKMQEKVGENGCCGCLSGRGRKMATIQTFNFGNKTIILLN